MKILIDTCILAELQRDTDTSLIRKALASIDDENIFLSVITIGEISKGIALLQESKRKNDLTHWLNGLENHFADRILIIDKHIAFMWGELTARAQKDGITVPACDGLIAATALHHGLHVMTRNIKHFQHTGVFLMGL